VLFVMNTPGFLRYYDETLDLLLERGHEVVLGFTNATLRANALEALEGRPRRPQLIGSVPRRTDALAPMSARLRNLVDFVRYLHPRYAEAGFLRDRRRLELLEARGLSGWLAQRDTLPRPAVAALVRGLLMLERAIPSAREVEALLNEIRPDVVLVSPLITGGSTQTDYIKSARALGISSGVAVASWDNLTNKGLIRELPDRVVVWNDAQRDEAVRLHGVPRERVVVTGAQPFDRWFGRRPTLSREAFCRRVGLHPQRPFLLFTGSTSNITDPGAEDRFVRRWAEAVRTARAPQLREAGLLVRPHPDRRGDWSNIDLEGLEEAVVWPPARPNSVTEEARAEYFDSLYHASVVVGINTSAMVEAAILGRPVLSLRLPEFHQAQRGTLHFAHMLPEHGGFLELADSLGEHLAQVQAAMEDPGPAQRRNRAFVERFVRPQGAQVPATPKLVAAVEQLAALGPAPARAGWALLPLRALLRARAVHEARQAARRAAPLDARLVRGRRLVESLDRVSGRLAPRAPRAACCLRVASKPLQRSLRWHRDRMKRRRREEKLHRASEKRRRRERAAAIRGRYIE
jgi:hypothetical protein